MSHKKKLHPLSHNHIKPARSRLFRRNDVRRIYRPQSAVRFSNASIESIAAICSEGKIQVQVGKTTLPPHQLMLRLSRRHVDRVQGLEIKIIAPFASVRGRVARVHAEKQCWPRSSLMSRWFHEIRIYPIRSDSILGDPIVLNPPKTKP